MILLGKTKYISVQSKIYFLAQPLDKTSKCVTHDKHNAEHDCPALYLGCWHSCCMHHAFDSLMNSFETKKCDTLNLQVENGAAGGSESMAG